MANNINCTCGHSWSKASSSKKDMYVCHICGKDNTMEDGGWLNKFEQGGMVLKQQPNDNYGKKANPNDVQASVGPDFVGLGYNIEGRNYSPAWGGQFAMGGALPGAVGFTYARTQNPAPSNGKYAKKTKASAQNGKEMKYYQEGLDFKPKTISQNGLFMDRFKEEKLPSDATRVVAPVRLTDKEQKQNVAINKQQHKNTEAYNKALLADRKAMRETKGDVFVPGSFHIAEKLRLAPNSPGGWGQVFDEYVNPAFVVGTLADNLGESMAANDDRGVATTLAMTAGLGLLGFDPLGDVMKLNRFSRGAFNNLGYRPQAASFGDPFKAGDNYFGGIGNLDEAAVAQQQQALARSRQAAISQGSQSSRVPYQFPTDEELLAMNLREAERYAPRVSRVGRQPMATPDDMVALNRPQLTTPDEFDWTIPTQSIDRSSTRIVPPPEPIRIRNYEPSSLSDFISEDDLVEPVPTQGRGTSRGYEITDADIARINSEPIEKQWNPDKFRIGQGDQSGRFVTKHPEGHYIREDIEVYDSGQAMRTYDIADANAGGQHIHISTTQQKGDPYVNVDNVSFFNRDPKSSSKQMNIVFSHLPKKVRIEPINTSIHSQPLLNTRIAKLSSGQPGRIQIEPLPRMSSLNQITRGGSSPEDWYNEIIDQFPKLERTYKTINEYTGSELAMPYIKYKEKPITFEQLKSPEFKRLVEEEGNLYNIGIMVNQYKTIKNWKNGGKIIDPMGQWAHPGEVTIIPGTDITMEGVDYPVLGISDTGDQQMMYPGEDYNFDGDYVTEYPMMKEGGWLSKYQDGGGLVMDRFKEEKVPLDVTRVSAPVRPLTKKEQKENVAINKQTQKNTEEYNKAVIADRKSKRETKGDLNVPGSFNITEKLRLFPESVGGVGEMFDEYINPGTIIGPLADSLGESIAAKSPEGVAATLLMTAGAGALGFDPLGGAIKTVKSFTKPSFADGKEALTYLNNVSDNIGEEEFLKTLIKKTGKTKEQLEVDFAAAVGNNATPKDSKVIINYANALRGKTNLPKLPKSLKELDEQAGKLVSPSSSSKFDSAEIVNRANEILEKGIGIKKKDIPVKLKVNPDVDNEIGVYVNDYNKSGYIQLDPNFSTVNKSSTFTNWLKGKKPTNVYDTYVKDQPAAMIKTGDFPYINTMSLEGTGVGAEAAEALKQALNEKGLQLYSSKSHTEAGKLRYLTDFLNNRKKVVDYNDNPDWINYASALKGQLGGSRISKKEVKEYMNQYPELKPTHVRFQYDKGGWLNKYK